MEAALVVTRNILWTLLPFFIGWVVYQLKQSKLNLDRLAFIVQKADEIVEWLQAEYPDMPYVDKVDRVLDMLIKALEEAGYPVGDEEDLQRAVIAAFNRYGQRRDLLERLKLAEDLISKGEASDKVKDEYLYPGISYRTPV
ncbi:MAG: hypothetical protein UMV23_05780 [Halanaerobium sp.]|nr:hypothetical protein [Halanaerobium sp.]